MDFTPSKTYAGLKLQAWALVRLVSSYEKQLAMYSGKSYADLKSKIKDLEEQVDSERQQNDLLTRELEKAEKMQKASNERTERFTEELIEELVELRSVLGRLG